MIRTEEGKACTALTWAEVDLGAIRSNCGLIRERVRPGVKLFAVVKADAYGHGAVKVAHALSGCGISMFCVARIEEAVELRESGVGLPVLVMTPPLPEQAEAAVRQGIEIVVCDEKHIGWMKECTVRIGRTGRVHLKVDLGMGRLGCPVEQAPGLARRIMEMAPELELAGVMSHFPCADCDGDESTIRIVEQFGKLREEIRSLGATGAVFHTSNTAGILRFPDAQFDAVRTGISLYGQYPSAGMERSLALVPAMSLKSRIVYLKAVPAGTPISYGGTYVTTRETRLATIPAGYADGFPRHASNRSRMIVRGQFADQIGRVCMDQLVLDVTDIPGVCIGDEVTAFGAGDGLTLAAEDVAARFDSLGYELTCRTGKRVPRFYVD